MTITRQTTRFLFLTVSAAALAGCTVSEMDWDLRSPNMGLDTTSAARQATANPPQPDSRGILSYPGYQVVLARRGDTVSTVAARIGMDAGELARYNAIQPGDPLRAGEILALPRRVSEPPPGSPGSTGVLVGGPLPSSGGGGIDVSTIASTAIDRAEGAGRIVGAGPAPAPVSAAPAPAPVSAEPIRHRVVRGETASTIARSYNVTTRALADWNGLGPDLGVREGQYLLIPTPTGEPPRRTAAVTAPGAGSPTPEPPSAARPLPAETTRPAAQPAPAPASPNLGADRTAASAARFVMPVDGRIIREFAPGRNNGIDIAAPAGTPVKAAAAGVVGAVTTDTNGKTAIAIKHDSGELTVYANVSNVTVQKGSRVTRGQQIAAVQAADPAFLRFEVLRGQSRVDPMEYLR